LTSTNCSVRKPLLRRDILLRHVHLEATGELASPLRVGSGREAGYLLQVLKDGAGRPYIPGTSWKGALRSAAERVAALLHVRVCPGTMIDEDDVRGIDLKLSNYLMNDIHDAGSWGGQGRRTYIMVPCTERRPVKDALKKADAGELEGLDGKICLNCKVFGAPSLRGALTIYDSQFTEYSLEVRPSISRGSRGEVANFFMVEFLDQGARFKLEADAMNLTNYALGYVLAALRGIHEGEVQLGGMKGRGLGFVRFNDLSLKISHVNPCSGSGQKLLPLDDLDTDVTLEVTEGAADEVFGAAEGLVKALQSAAKTGRLSPS
jgi:CRISPR/Cas system CSM-associated protein Csm3 (group 7 of RAMP superfamily)